MKRRCGLVVVLNMETRQVITQHMLDRILLPQTNAKDLGAASLEVHLSDGEWQRPEEIGNNTLQLVNSYRKL